jgi:HK97 family phage prohead protease
MSTAAVSPYRLEPAGSRGLDVVGFRGLELRAAAIAGPRSVEGIAVPWNEISYLTPEPTGERFLPGSCTKSVAVRGAKLKLFRNHNHSVALGKAVYLDPQDRRGLFARWQIARTPAGDEALQEISEGALDAFSVGFRTVKARRGFDGVRDIVEADVHEVSIAPLTAYAGAVVTGYRADVPQQRTAGHTIRQIDNWIAAHPAPSIDPEAIAEYERTMSRIRGRWLRR